MCSEGVGGHSLPETGIGACLQSIELDGAVANKQMPDACSEPGPEPSPGEIDDRGHEKDLAESAKRSIAKNQRLKQMRYSRRLQQAIDEGARPSVLRAALAQASEAGCNGASLAGVMTRGRALLPFVEALEAAKSTECEDTLLEAIAKAEQGGALAHVERAKEHLVVLAERRAREEVLESLQNLALGKSTSSLEAALQRARNLGVDAQQLEQYEIALRSLRAAEEERRLQRLRAAEEERHRQIESAASCCTPDQEAAMIRTLEEATSAAELADWIELALKAGIDDAICEKFKSRLRTASEATAELERALLAQSSEQLQAAIRTARQTMADPNMIAKGEAALSAIEAKCRFEAERADAILNDAIVERCCEVLKHAIDIAKKANGTPGLIARAEAVLYEEEQKDMLRAQLKAAARQLLELAAIARRWDDLDGEIEKMRCLVDAGRRGGLSDEDLSEYTRAVASAEAKRAARAKLFTSTTDVNRLDFQIATLEVLVNAKRQLFSAMEAALEARLSETELSEPERLRRRLHNAIEDRKGIVRVYCRVRPLIDSEIATRQEVAFRCKDSFTLEMDACAGERLAGRLYHFDSCWMPGSQHDVFEDTKDLVQSSIDGYNVTIFAYGQTGAGKTYTMYGEQNSNLQGICPRAAEELFRLVANRQDRCDFSVTLSMTELYCKRFFDLLDVQSKKNLRIRTAQNGEVYVENAYEQVVTSAADVLRLVNCGAKERHSRDTQLNIGSSRSHLLFCLKVHSTNRETGQILCGKMLLVDLAGSERVRKSGVTGDGLREACEINTSLSALGDVIQALVRGDSHVPYRNHELTQVMQDSLGGTAKTLMFVNLSPTAVNLEETLMSLKYAQRAKGVYNDASGPPSQRTKSPIRYNSTSRHNTPRASLSMPSTLVQRVGPSMPSTPSTQSVLSTLERFTPTPRCTSPR